MADFENFYHIDNRFGILPPFINQTIMSQVVGLNFRKPMDFNHLTGQFILNEFFEVSFGYGQPLMSVAESGNSLYLISHAYIAIIILQNYYEGIRRFLPLNLCEWIVLYLGEMGED